jgi:hypothetical protein
MTIVAIKEAAAHAGLIAAKAGKHDWTAPYILTSDNPRDDGLTCVEYMTSIGRGVGTRFKYGDRTDDGTYCKTIAPTRMSNSVDHWAVILTYSQNDGGKGSNEDDEPTDDPLDWRYEISSGTQFFQVPVWQAWNMDVMPLGGAGGGYQRPLNTLGPVHNSAGIVYDPPLTRDVPEMVLRVSGNALYYWSAMLQVTGGTINQFEIGWSKRLCAKYGFVAQYFRPCCVLCNSATADYRFENGLAFWRYTFEFRLRQPADEINPQDGFLESVLDRGLTRIANPFAPDGHGGTFPSENFKAGMAEAAAIRDVEDRRVPEMVLLDGHGQPLRGSDTLAAPPVYFRWRVHPYGVFTYPWLPLDIFGV